MKTSLTRIVFLLLITYTARAQHLTHDVGVFGGVAVLQTDYGQRGNFLSSYGNSGLSFSFAHYLHFFNKNTRWDSGDELFNYIMVKSEVNFMTGNNLQHHGVYVNANSDLARQLKAMTGSVSITNLGIQLEYYLKGLQDFINPYSQIKWNPYIAFGFRYAFYNNTLTSDLGDWRTDITVLPTKYREPGALAVGSGSSFAFTFGIGTRYKLTEDLDLAGQLAIQSFLSDAVDGLQAEVIENKNNEWLMNLQFGIIYHLNFNNPLFDW